MPSVCLCASEKSFFYRNITHNFQFLWQFKCTSPLIWTFGLFTPLLHSFCKSHVLWASMNNLIAVKMAYPTHNIFDLTISVPQFNSVHSPEIVRHFLEEIYDFPKNTLPKSKDCDFSLLLVAFGWLLHRINFFASYRAAAWSRHVSDLPAPTPPYPFDTTPLHILPLFSSLCSVSDQPDEVGDNLRCNWLDDSSCGDTSFQRTRDLMNEVRYSFTFF